MTNKFYISLTTSPTRLPLLATTLMSVIEQKNVQAEKILVHLPKIFKRTNESYPDNLSNVFSKKQMKIFAKNKVVFHRIPEDYGPITKLVGALLYLQKLETTDNTFIVTVDDDIQYNLFVLDAYNLAIERGLNTMALGFSGLMFAPNPILQTESLVAVFGNRLCDILEGYLSVCYNLAFFQTKTFWSYLETVLTNKECFLSDDLVISNWLSRLKIYRLLVSFPFVSREIMWNNKAILEFGDKEDALHNGAGGGMENNKRYYTAKLFLKSNELLSPEFKVLEN